MSISGVAAESIRNKLMQFQWKTERKAGVGLQ
jgi:hypothetical protein